MTEPTEKETKWFVKKLIDLRDKVDGYHEPFDFELKDLEVWGEETKTKLPQAETKDRVIWMLDEIKKHYIENNNNPIFTEGLKYKKSEDGKKITIDGYTTKMLTEYKNWLSLSRAARLALVSKPLEKKPTIKFRTKGKIFELNINDGSFKFGNTKDEFGIKTQEFKFLKCLVESRGNAVSYEIIFSCLGLKDSLESRGKITTILKRIKHKMKILVKRGTSNPDIFRNITNFGYEILED